ncbi:T9SS type A sorting domain-containing protein [Candidatus Aerophobetes bacterium]|uniref:T9SS type A sorting domain-containing protein n=1 Tax=Aerophobetes bacterium TaxID=2030807 RepID=A0A523S3W8_UNCAE|nr:MAG: T9SS type A sorting domain-containing protein [Candidatus Aerophobetes bacterium]
MDDLGEQNDTVWKLYRWNTANGSYDKYLYVGNFSPGKAFWIISKDVKTVDTGPGTDVTRQSDFVISLPSGWSQIGNPFPFSVSWNEVIVRRDAEVVSILEAQAKGWVRDKIWYWDGQSYLVYQAPLGTIDPYKGYWAKALFDCELLLPPDEAQGAKVSGQTVKAKEEFLQLKAKVGELEDNYNFLGFSEAAKDSYDRLDVEEPPPISSYISLFFPHPEWGKNKGDYTQDIRAGISQTGLKQVWDFQVKTDQINQKIIVEWENTSAFPEDIHLYLTDSFWNVLANMREKCFYRFTSTSSLESFKIIATSEAPPLPEDLDLIEVYSYPNPAHGKGVQFHFYLASPAKVTIKIYSISGELVKTLINEKACVAGVYEEFWKEDNDRGEKLARGVYIYIIQAGNSAKVVSKSGKIGLLD